MTDNWRVVGRVGVDSGCIIIADPAYAEKVTEDEVMDAVNDHAGPIAGDLGVVVSTGLGDGMYDVEARIEDIEGWGERVAEVRIRFLPHPVIGGLRPEDLQR